MAEHTVTVDRSGGYSFDYQARCSCGYRGTLHGFRWVARMEANRHIRTTNRKTNTTASESAYTVSESP